jgi:hypothetical protein
MRRRAQDDVPTWLVEGPPARRAHVSPRPTFDSSSARNHDCLVWYRAMTPEMDGLPRVARSARALGVRVPQDVVPDATGHVAPETGGMSVAPDSVFNLPNHRRPRGLGHGSTGPGADWVFGITLPPLTAACLLVRPDPRRPHKHAFVEPRNPVSLEGFEASLTSTRPSWSRVWP